MKFQKKLLAHIDYKLIYCKIKFANQLFNLILYQIEINFDFYSLLIHSWRRKWTLTAATITNSDRLWRWKTDKWINALIHYPLMSNPWCVFIIIMNLSRRRVWLKTIDCESINRYGSISSVTTYCPTVFPFFPTDKQLIISIIN